MTTAQNLPRNPREEFFRDGIVKPLSIERSQQHPNAQRPQGGQGRQPSSKITGLAL